MFEDIAKVLPVNEKADAAIEKLMMQQNQPIVRLRRMTTPELSQLLEVLRANGVTKYVTSELTLELEPITSSQPIASKASEPTADEIMFYSSGLGPPPLDGWQPTQPAVPMQAVDKK